MLPRGFTLIELLIVIAIFGILSVVAIPFARSFQSTSDVYTYTDTIAKAIRSAHHRAVVGERNTSWGVFFNTSEKKVVLYAGQTYEIRQAEFDQEFSYPAQFNLSTDFGTEVVFRQFSGVPSAAGIISLLNVGSTQTSTIAIASTGLVEVVP